MNFISKIIGLLLFILRFSAVYPQTASIGQWNSYLSLNAGVDLIKRGNHIYAGTGRIPGVSGSSNGGGVFSFDILTEKRKTFSTVEGLHHVDVTSVELDKANEVVVGYSNGDIDVIDLQDGIRNIGDIKRSTQFPDRRINHSVEKGDSIFFSVNFGVVVYDNKKQEVREDYTNLGSNPYGSAVYGIAFLDTAIFAGTDYGVVFASLNSSNLKDSASWKNFGPADGLPKTYCPHLATFRDTVYALIQNTLYKYTNPLWEIVKIFPVNNVSLGRMKTYGDHLNIIRKDSAGIFRTWSLSASGQITDIPHTEAFFIRNPLSALTDETGALWIVDAQTGLIRYREGQYNMLTPNRPSSNFTSRMSILRDDLWVGSKGYTASFEPYYEPAMFYRLKHATGEWRNYNGLTDSILQYVKDCENVSADEKRNAVYVGSFFSGFLEIKDETITLFDTTNTDMATVAADGSIRVTGTATDGNGNLWVINYLSSDPLSVRTPEGNWKTYSFGNLVLGTSLVRVTVDDYNQVWMTMRNHSGANGGIIVLDYNGTPLNTNDDRYKRLTRTPTDGGLASNDVRTVVSDKDGVIWVGTTEGVSVYYDPLVIFSGSNFDADCPVFEQRCLLKDQQVNCIAVDGGNRKWIGTNSGIWLFTEDGSYALANFTVDNSPLVSNVINDIIVHPKTGEVFISTAGGLMSIMGTATEGSEKMNEVFVYPNPVFTDYSGLIGIRGLAKNATLKITDITGNLVRNIDAEGGMAVWDGKDLTGAKVHTGIYVILISDKDGKIRNAAKIAVIQRGK